MYNINNICNIWVFLFQFDCENKEKKKQSVGRGSLGTEPNNSTGGGGDSPWASCLCAPAISLFLPSEPSLNTGEKQ